MEQGLRQQLEEAVSEKTIDEGWRRETVRGGNLQDHLMRAAAEGVESLLDRYSAEMKLDRHLLTMRAQSRISAAMPSLAEIRNLDTRREHAVGLVTRCIADVAFEMLAHQVA